MKQQAKHNTGLPEPDLPQHPLGGVFKGHQVVDHGGVDAVMNSPIRSGSCSLR